MAYEPLHHKYRPQTFAELVGQDAIATTLTTAIQRQQIAPAYLFTGARGTGKTSSARILAKSLNCLSSEVPTAKPCGTCEVCRSIAQGNAVDVIEIDAASHTGVDNIRELIERSRFAPMQCRYKVYVIDECHMLSAAAFNALLKTLEEPPPHVVFVLATTDPQRVLPTIISRCQRFDYRRIDLGSMTAHLQTIAQKESIPITAAALQLVAQISQGGLRDAESLLDQLSLIEGEISTEAVWEFVGAVAEQDLLELVDAIAKNNPTNVLEQVRKLMDRGREPLIVLQNLASFYRDLLIAKTSPHRNDLVAITPPTWVRMCELVQTWETATLLQGQQRLRESELQVKNTTQPRLWLEVALLGLLPGSIQTSPQPIAQVSLRRSPGTTSVAERNSTLAVSSDQPSVAPADIPNSLLNPSSTFAHTARNTLASEDLASEILASDTLGHQQISSRDSNSSNQATSEENALASPLSELTPSIATPLTPTEPQIDLSQVWQNLLSGIRFRGTQTLLQQHGTLLLFDGQKARVGMRTPQLLQIMQSKLQDIEVAFEQFYGRKIKVMLEVTSATGSDLPGSDRQNPIASTSSNRSSKPSRSLSASVPAVVPAASPGILPSSAQTVTPTVPLSSYAELPASTTSHSARESSPPSISNNGNLQGNPLPESSSSPPKQQSVSIPPANASVGSGAASEVSIHQPPNSSINFPFTNAQSIDSQPSWYVDEVQEAAKSLAQFFNGQIVTPIEEISAETIADELTIERSSVELSETDSDPDKDVPF